MRDAEAVDVEVAAHRARVTLVDRGKVVDEGPLSFACPSAAEDDPSPDAHDRHEPGPFLCPVLEVVEPPIRLCPDVVSAHERRGEYDDEGTSQ